MESPFFLGQPIIAEIARRELLTIHQSFGVLVNTIVNLMHFYRSHIFKRIQSILLFLLIK